jgi:hypothetical protein
MIFGMSLYLDELQFKFEFRSGRMIFGWAMALELVFFVQILRCPDLFLTSFDIMRTSRKSPDNLKFKQNTSSRDITQPNIIRPERNSNLKCNSSRYSEILNIIRILFRLNDFWLSYAHWTYIFCSNFKLSVLFFDVLWYIDLIFGSHSTATKFELKL